MNKWRGEFLYRSGEIVGRVSVDWTGKAYNAFFVSDHGTFIPINGHFATLKEAKVAVESYAG